MKLSFNLFGHRYIYSAQRIRKPFHWTYGITSRIPGTSMHIHLLDYDIIREDNFEEELIFLQEAFKLGDIHLFRTRDMGIYDESPVGGYHAVCLDVDTTFNVIKVLRSSNCDYAFKNAPIRNPLRTWVLRIADKGKERPPPEFLRTLKSEAEISRMQSTFHARLLDDWYGLDIESQLVNPDGNEWGYIHHYDTAKRVK